MEDLADLDSIYDDIQALRERFRREFGIEVRVSIYAFPHVTDNNQQPTYQPGKLAADLVTKGGIPASPESKQHGDTAWIELVTDDGETDVTLFY